LGVDEITIDLMQKLSLQLEEAKNTKNLLNDNYFNQKQYISSLEKNCDSMYEKAKEKLLINDEIGAKEYLKNALNLKSKISAAVDEASLTSNQLDTIEVSISSIESRINELNLLIARTKMANSNIDNAIYEPITSTIEDPLEKRFRELERGGDNN
jgi:phage shock protein A